MKCEAAGNNLYGDNDHRRKVILVPIGLIIKNISTSSSGKKFKKFEDARIACLMYKRIKISKDSVDLPFGFRQGIATRERVLAITKKTNGNNHFSFLSKDILALLSIGETQKMV